MNDATPIDPTAPLTPGGNLRRRQLLSRLTEYGATSTAVLAVAVLIVVIYTVVARGAGAVSLDFLVKAAPAGVGPELVGTAIIVGIATAITLPLGVLIAIFTTELGGNRGVRAIRLTLDLMNGLPSIIIGLFIFELLVSHQKQSGFAASVALSVIMLPLIARGSQEVLLLVPSSLREAAEALGVSRWRTVLGVILPAARGGILTSTVLSIARAAGETAPLILLTSVFDPGEYTLNPFEALPNIPVRIFQLSEEANPAGFGEAWGLALVLVAFILVANLGARALFNRSRAKLTS